MSDFEDNPDIGLLAALSDSSMRQDDLMQMIRNEENI